MKPSALRDLAVAAAIAASAIPGIAYSNDGTLPRSGGIALDLRATSYNAGRIGQAVLLPQDRSTRVVLTFSGVPGYVTRPVHIYTYIYDATCANLPQKPVFSLNDRVLVDSVTGATAAGAAMMTISHTIPVPLDDLRSGRYAIGLRTAPADGDRLIFCGDISRA